MKTAGPAFDLRSTQLWVQYVATHPQGVTAALEAPESRALLGIGIQDLEQVILPGPVLSAAKRIELYANMIGWRLVDCLAGDYPTVQHAVGDDTFDALARAYLTQHPSEHYSLNQLGAKFPEYLRDEAPDLKNRHLLAELAELEWSLQVIFDAPRAEELTRVQLMAVPHEVWPDLRLRFIPACRFFAFRYAVNTYLQAVRDERKTRLPRLRDSYVCVHRHSYKVFREDLDRPRYTILNALREGATVGTALEQAAELPGVKLEALAAKVGGWFQDWAALGLFAGIEAG